MQLRDHESISNPDQAAEIQSILTRTGWTLPELSARTGFNAGHLQKALRGARRLKGTSMDALRYAAQQQLGALATPSPDPAATAGATPSSPAPFRLAGDAAAMDSAALRTAAALLLDRDLQDKLAAIHQRGGARAVSLLKKLVDVVYGEIGHPPLGGVGSAAPSAEAASPDRSPAAVPFLPSAFESASPGENGMTTASLPNLDTAARNLAVPAAGQASAAGAAVSARLGRAASAADASAASVVRALVMKGLPGNLRFLPVFGHIPAGVPDPVSGKVQPDEHVGIPADKFREADFALKVRGESMNAAAAGAINAGDIVLLTLRRRENPPHNAIVAALVDGETCLKRLKRQGGEVFLHSESDDPGYQDIVPVQTLEIQGVMVGKV